MGLFPIALLHHYIYNGLVKRFGEGEGVKVLFAFQGFGETTENLAGDDAGIPSGAHQKAHREGFGKIVDVFIVPVLDLFGAGGERQVHVHAGIAIGDGENV